MRFTAVFALAAFSSAVLALPTGMWDIDSFSSSCLRWANGHVVFKARQDDVASILSALRTNNPEDADAASTLTKRAPQDNVAGILAALRENSPDDADAASTLTKRAPQDDVASILTALRTNSPEDAD